MSESRSLEEMKTFLKSCDGFDSQQTMNFYNRWAETYDQDLCLLRCRGPHLAADFLSANFSGDRETTKVLDVACGSGLVAKAMSELGFRNFAGVDSSEGMLQKAAKTGLYQDLQLALLGTQPLPAQTGSFDVVIIVGGLGVGFAPVRVVRELCDAAKPGGLVCIVKGEHSEAAEEEYQKDVEKELQLMEEEGLWSPVESTQADGYMIDVNRSAGRKKAFCSAALYLYRKSRRS